MDDLTHNCPDCHEVTRAPAAHTCGRTPQGTLLAHQPHTQLADFGRDFDFADTGRGQR